MNKKKLNLNQRKLNHDLYDAIINGKNNKVKEAIKMGANVNADDDFALYLAIYYGRLELVDLIRLCMKNDKMSKSLVKIILKGV